jgi:hypothetical protein
MESAENNWDVFQHVEESAKFEFLLSVSCLVPAKRVSSSSCRRDRSLKFADAVDLKPFRRSKKSVQTIPNSADDEVLVLFVGYYWKQEAGAPFDGQYAHGSRHHLLELGPYSSRCVI